ncbi:flagellin [Bradyrhizobium sp. U87765 SZCCT0131]|uniref:flagellin n=1 Tax=unclassified Bradyrhizobium TaxID=2631580 RepID=UPI001BAE2BEA|nr:MULTISPECIES: flagellin [unclassified Bradyrhizobium]MBR1220948.1 flagellin [Bradyrhizobium sp. U87765 SZCCT0131]MBR1260232.1 flagellin [Bradyrhizobium sp. U87765 SZCCT0134]MBR1307519.1 flagellin [Bradyrhizobium sp. U87765 SZCCT0110]MBR1321473.1 flagellin [Bradyrhizobium sp. U87765 SZCCT0109]MBR1349786.1 flagellin [Bradyrhizobium sp. U87765 SZCCT0048]
MTMRVATFPLSEQMINSALRTQSVMATDQLEEASGVSAQDYGDLGATSKQVINLQISVSRSEAYSTAAAAADSRTQVMYSAVTSISNLLTQFRSTLTAASNTANTNSTTVTQTAQQLMSEMGSLLNTQYGGEYLFGGSNTTTPPVNVSSSAYPPVSASTPSTSYYQGNDEAASVRVSETQTVTYGVTADNTAFEQGLRALNLVANNSPLSTANLTAALNLTVSAVSATSAVQAQLGLSSSSMQTASATQSDYQTYARSLSDNLTGVDVAAVTAQLSSYQAQLEASYSAIAKIQGLSLSSYLH